MAGGVVVSGTCPNNLLNGPPVDGCVIGAELPKMLTVLVDVAGVCPNGLLEGLKVELDWPNSGLEDEGALVV